MSPHIVASIRQQKLRILSLILLASFLVLCCDGVVTSAAQSSQKEEREFEEFDERAEEEEIIKMMEHTIEAEKLFLVSFVCLLILLLDNHDLQVALTGTYKELQAILAKSREIYKRFLRKNRELGVALNGGT